jgi:molybdopterin synthase sulfur carrier subunit
MRLLYFSMVRELIGKEEEEIEFKGTISQLKELLSSKYPEAGDLIKSIRFAVNEEYVDDKYYLKGDERVALIPPVSGG